MEDYADNTHKSMPEGASGLTRREFMAWIGKLSIAAAALGSGKQLPAAQEAMPALPPSRVMKVHNRRVLNGLKVNRLRLNSMIDSSVKAFAKCDNLADAWGKFIKPHWKILVKFTQFTGVGPSGEFEMMQALLDSIGRGGFDLGNVAIAGCRFGEYRSDIRPLVNGWSQKKVKIGQASEQIRRYLENTDAIINVPSLTDHVQFGVNCSMLNVSEAFIRRPGRFVGSQAHEMIAGVCKASKRGGEIPPVALNIVNALRSGYNGGPKVVGAHMVSTSELWLSHDMVAIDRLAWQWIDRQRLRNSLKTLAQEGRSPDFLAIAAQNGLGNNKIDSIKIEPVEL